MNAAASSLTQFGNGAIMPSPVLPGLVPSHAVLPAPPLIPDTAMRRPRRAVLRPWMVVLLAAFLIVAWGIWSVTGFFRLSSPSAALRNSTMTSAGGMWKTKLALSLGRGSIGLVRLVSSFVQMPPEGRAALNGLQGGEVGIYEMTGGSRPINAGQVLAGSDKEMMARGWARVVAAVRKNDLVAIYAPKKGVSQSRVQCSVMVLHEGRMVVVGARANPSELMKALPGSFDWEKRVSVTR